MRDQLASEERKVERRAVSGRHSQRWRVRPTLLALEERRLLSTFTVNNATDTPVSGKLDLRQAIAAANSAGGTNTIAFDSTVFSTPKTITLGGIQLELSKGTVTITGPAAGVTVSGGGISRVFQVDANVTASISGMTITGGNSRISNNFGGGLYNNGGTVTLTNCTVSSNYDLHIGGGLNNSAGTMTLNYCTVSGNTAGTTAGGLNNIHNGTITLTDCTLSGNSALIGGGLTNGLGTITLTNCTVSGNTAKQSPGGVYNISGTVTIGNTIVAGNTGGLPDVEGTFASNGHNLIGKTDGSSGWVSSDKQGTIASPLNPLLAALGNNGGPTQTMALLSGSPAIDAGSNALIPSGVTTDQRGAGYPRIVNGTVDIGAFELINVSTPTFSALTSPTIVYGTPTTTLTGHLGSATAVPTGLSVSITLDSVVQTSTVDGNGNFTTTFSTTSLGVPGSPYSVTYAFAGSSNFNAASDTSTSVTVTKATATVVVTPYSVTYDGSSYTATVASITGVNGETGATVGTVDVSDTTHTGAGTYASDTWSFTGGADYNDITSTTITDAIAKATPTATLAVTNSPQTYTATGQSAAVGISMSSVAGSVANILTGGAGTQTNAGSYAVTADFVPSDTSDYNTLTGLSAGNFVIEKADATVMVTPYSVTYDGSPHTATYTVTGVGTDTAAAGTSITLNTTHTSAGTYSSDSWSFTGGANYNNIASTTITDVIGKATPTATLAVSNSPQTYNATGQAAAVSISTSSVAGAVANILTGGAATQTNAGTYAVTASFVPTDTTDYNTLTGLSAGNFVIGQATATISVTPYNITYDGNPHTATGTATGVGGVNLIAGLNLSGTTHTIAGTYLDTWTFTDATGNYSNSSGTVTDTISPASAPWSIVVLDATVAGALTLSGNASINVSGAVYVDSSSSTALTASGNVSAKASVIDVHGGVKKSGNVSFNPAPVTGAAVVPDPLGSLSQPGTSGLPYQGSVSLSGNSSQTIAQGIYSKITVSGNAKLTMSGGTYIILGGGIAVSGNASVSGSGVMIVNAGSNYPSSGGTFGSISLGGNGSYSLSPQTSGSYAGILIFQTRDNTQSLTMSGNASGISGTIYAPMAALSDSGNGALHASLIVDTLAISGNGGVNTPTVAWPLQGVGLTATTQDLSVPGAPGQSRAPSSTSTALLVWDLALADRSTTAVRKASGVNDASDAPSLDVTRVVFDIPFVKSKKGIGPFRV